MPVSPLPKAIIPGLVISDRRFNSVANMDVFSSILSIINKSVLLPADCVKNIHELQI